MQRPLSLPSFSLVLLGVLVLALLTLAHGRNRVYFSEVTLWQDAAMRTPGKQRTHHNYGCALARAGRFEEAVRALDGALAQENDGSILLHYLLIEKGNAFYRLERYDEALNSWMQALAASPGNREIMTNIAVVLVKQGRTGEALGYARSALLTSAPLAETLEVMGEIALKQRRYSEASSYLLAALRKDPDLGSAYRTAALALEAAGSYEAANRIVQQYLVRKSEGEEREEMIGISRRLQSRMKQ
jgi:tetratricopeptide (TPR) repeat protein